MLATQLRHGPRQGILSFREPFAAFPCQLLTLRKCRLLLAANSLRAAATALGRVGLEPPGHAARRIELRPLLVECDGRFYLGPNAPGCHAGRLATWRRGRACYFGTPTTTAERVVCAWRPQRAPNAQRGPAKQLAFREAFTARRGPAIGVNLVAARSKFLASPSKTGTQQSSIAPSAQARRCPA